MPRRIGWERLAVSRMWVLAIWVLWKGKRRVVAKIVWDELRLDASVWRLNFQRPPRYLDGRTMWVEDECLSLD